MLYAQLLILILFITLCQSEYDGPASIDYFKQSFNVSTIGSLRELRCWDEWKEWNGWKRYNTYFGQTNVSDISYVFFNETNNLNPVEYYVINITSKMKEKYKSSMYVTTTCELSEVCSDSTTAKNIWNTTLSECGIYAAEIAWWRYHTSDPPNGRIAHYNEYCNYSSLDTFMYILHEKKGRINLIQSKDDCSSSDNCIIKTKSLIDLLNYDEGVYIIDIGGYGTEYGKYQIQLTCLQNSYPITISEINPHHNLGCLTCSLILHDQSLTNDNHVVYYALNITQNTYFPFTISICTNEDWELDAYIVGMDKLGLNYDVITKFTKTDKDSSICLYNNYKVTIDEHSDNILVGNTYWIMLQGFINHAMDFSIYMQCNDPPTPSPTKEPSIAPTRIPTISPTKSPTTPPKIPQELVMTLVFGLCGAFIVLFIVYYIYKWKQYIDKRKKDLNIIKSPKIQKVPQQDTESDNDKNELELTTLKVISRAPNNVCNELERPQREGSTVSIRSLHGNKSVVEQLEENEDVVQLILSDAIQSCIDQSGFDIYQVLALRYCNIASQNVIPRKPFIAIGINIELIELSPFITSAFCAIIIGLTQTFGISMVIYKLFTGYFEDGDIFDGICVMDEDRWGQVFSLKVLSFLLSLVITLFIGGLINGVKHDGLYEIMAKLSLKHMERIPHVTFFILQIGQGINYYTCFWAVIGSYFIIFVSNTGELQDDGSSDYSSAGLEMILNAIALFFMLELDDMLVSDQDYDDCQKHLENVLNNYVPDTRINRQYISGDYNDRDYNDSDKGRVDGNIQSKFGKYEGYVISFMYHLINLFSVIVTVCCYGGGFIAPFIIFFCW